jgi:CheY-like chemotaxis protein
VRPAALAKRIELECTIAGGGAITGDPNRLQQVMWNLLSNAVKFTPTEGKVKVTLEQDGPELVIKVADSGIGIAPEFLPHVFDRFRQADASTTRRHGGLGLGLAIARQLVELQGGTIAVDSEGAGRGTTFVVRFPLRHQPAPAWPQGGGNKQASSPVPFSSEDLAGVRVLVVDDMADTLDLTGQMLQSRGACTVLASSAQEALELLAAGQFDVVVSDIAMPEMDGYELVRRMRAQGLAVPAVALTAFTRPEDREHALQAGFEAYVAKPLEAGALVAAIAGLLYTPA